MSESTDNYLKTIYSLSKGGSVHVSTSSLSEKMNTKASSVTDMLKKLNIRGLVIHKPYKGVSLTEAGEKIALEIVRRHRIWEVFLTEKLGFGWDEVHEIAEQLEHITSKTLIDKLDNFLQHPQFDPHGDPIPDGKGRLPKSTKSIRLAELREGEKARIVSVDDSSSQLLLFLEKSKLKPGSDIQVKKRLEFDGSIQIKSKSRELMLSDKAAQFIYVHKQSS